MYPLGLVRSLRIIREAAVRAGWIIKTGVIEAVDGEVEKRMRVEASPQRGPTTTMMQLRGLLLLVT